MVSGRSGRRVNDHGTEVPKSDDADAVGACGQQPVRHKNGVARGLAKIGHPCLQVQLKDLCEVLVLGGCVDRSKTFPDGRCHFAFFDRKSNRIAVGGQEGVDDALDVGEVDLGGDRVGVG